MSRLVVETPEGISLRYELAGAGSRGAAALVDLVLFVLGFLALLIAAFGLSQLDPTGVSGFFAGLVAGGFSIGLVLYQVLFALVSGGRTPGKMLFGLRVVDQHGHPAAAFQHFLRGLFWPLEALLAIPLSFGLILIAATERRQRLGDLVAGTVVLRDRLPDEVGEPYPRKRSSDLPRRRLELSPALAARFDAEDLRFLRRLLGRHDFEPARRDALLVGGARHFAGVLGVNLPERLTASDAGELLRELYLHLRDARSDQSS